MTDPLCHFARRASHMAIRCPMLLNAILALSASRINRVGRPGIRRSTFWTYVRQEIMVAIQRKTSTNIDIESWQREMYWGEVSDDAGANRITWLMVKVINYCYGNNRPEDVTWKSLQHEVNNWQERYPLTLGPLYVIDSNITDEEPFPMIYYTCIWHGR